MGESKFTLDMRGLKPDFSFQDMANVFDAFVRAWKHAPRIILVTQAQHDAIYPPSQIHRSPTKWRDVPLKVKDDL